MIFLKRLLKEHWPVLIIVFLGLTPLFWFRQGFIIAGGDAGRYLNPSADFLDFFSVWSEKMNAGFVNFNLMEAFPFSFFWFALKLIGFSLINIERLWAFFLFFLPGFFIYCLVLEIFKDNGPKKKLIGLIAAIFYMFNPFVALQVLQASSRLVQLALPLILLFWLKGLNSSRFSFQYPILIGLASLFVASASINLAVVSVIPLCLFLYLCYFFVTRQAKFVFGLKLALATAVFCLLINLWWLTVFFPGAVKMSDPIQKAILQAGFLDATSLTESFRLLGNWAFKSFFYQSVPLVPFAHFYYEPIFTFLGFLLTIFTFSFLWFKFKVKNPEILFFGFLALLGLFLVKGTNPPFGGLYRFLYENMPGFWIFRNPYMKFSLLSALGFSILLGFSAQRISQWLKKGGQFWPKAFPCLAIIAILFLSFPILTGAVIQNESWYGLKNLSFYVKVPDYWKELSSWFRKNDSSSRVLLLPPAGYGQTYNWESGFSSSGAPAEFLISNPLIVYPSNKNTKADFLLDRLFGEIFANNRTELLDSLVKLFDVKYIVNQNDFDWRLSLSKLKDFSAEKVKQTLDQSQGIELISSFGKLDLYSVKGSANSSRRFYIPQKVNLVWGKTDFLFEAIEPEQAVFSVEDLKDRQEDVLLENRAGIIISALPKKALQDGLEYSFFVPRTAVYDIYLKRTDVLNENKFGFLESLALELNGEAKKPVFLSEEKGKGFQVKEKEFKDCRFKELRHCASCSKKFKKIFTCEGLKNIIPENSLLKEIIFDKKPISLNSDWQNLEIEEDLEEELKVAKIESLWSFGQNLGVTDLYESQIPVPFPNFYDSNPQSASPFMVLKNGVPLENFWNVASDKPDLVKVSSKPPLLRRIFITIPKKEKPFSRLALSEQYEVWYLDSLPILKQGLKVKFVQDRGYIWLGNLLFVQGEYKLKLPVFSGAMKEVGRLVDDDPARLTLALNSTSENSDEPLPALSFERKNSTRYLVQVKDVSKSFFLVFQESYDSGWRVFVNGKKIKAQNHFLANGYANAWLIEQTGDLKIKLGYSNQRWLFFSWLISGLSLVGGIIYLLRFRKIRPETSGFSSGANQGQKSVVLAEKKISFYLKIILGLSRFLFFVFGLLIIMLVYFLIFGSRPAESAEKAATYAFIVLVVSVILRFFYEQQR